MKEISAGEAHGLLQVEGDEAVPLEGTLLDWRIEGKRDEQSYRLTLQMQDVLRLSWDRVDEGHVEDARLRCLHPRLILLALLFMISLIVLDVCLVLVAIEDTKDIIRRLLLRLACDATIFYAIHAILYVTLLSLLAEHELQLTSDLRRQLANCSSRTEPLTLMQKRRQVMQLKSDFDSIFNFVPMSLLVLPFFTVPGAVVSLREGVKESHTSQTLLETGLYVLPQVGASLSLLLIVWRACRCCERVDRAAAELVNDIRIIVSSGSWQRGPGSEAAWQMLLHQVTEERTFTLTAGGIFAITRSLLFSFASSLVGISVLVIQLFNN